MRYKFIDLTDTGTIIPIMIIEFEDIDDVFLKKTGWGAGFRVVLNFSTKRATCISGKSFRDRFGETIEHLSQKMDSNGTIISFKEALNYISDIRQLPDEFNVCEFRRSRNWVRTRRFIDREIYEILEDYGLEYCKSHIRKHNYMNQLLGYTHVSLFDTKEKKILSDIGRSSSHRFDMLAEYMWIPVPEANDEEINCFKKLMTEEEL